MKLDVELREIVGQKIVMIGGKKTEVDVKFDQFSIMVNGSEIGLVCKAPGSPVNFLPIANNYPLDARNEIAELVKAELAKRESGDVVPRPVFQPPSQESVDAASAAMAKMEAAENGDAEPDESNL